MFWNNILQFPRFLLSVIVGFFLTISNPIFESLKSSKRRSIATVILIAAIIFFVLVLRSMLAIN